jgi:hypothetical protein
MIRIILILLVIVAVAVCAGIISYVSGKKR